jgi:hypothetical protein
MVGGQDLFGKIVEYLGDKFKVCRVLVHRIHILVGKEGLLVKDRTADLNKYLRKNWP